MVEFVRDVMIAVAVLATVLAFAVRSHPEHEPTPRSGRAEQPKATDTVAKTTFFTGIRHPH